MLNKETLVISFKLFLITAISALFLAVVNKVTTPVIEHNTKMLEISAQQEVLPDADEFIASEIVKSENNAVTINKLNAGIDKENGSLCGYVVTATSHEGYGGDLKVMVGIDKDLKVTRVKIVESSETAGLGANASKPKFIDQFIGADKNLNVVTGLAGDDEISAIASATITSKAVTACVNAALDTAKLKNENSTVEETAKKLEKIKKETKEQIAESEGGKTE
jgi:electron transport complex protein RnfG